MEPAPKDPAEQYYLRYFYRNWRPARFGRIWSRAYAWASGLGLTPQTLITLQVKSRSSGRLYSTILVAADPVAAFAEIAADYPVFRIDLA